jgi:hypothetical protein
MEIFLLEPGGGGEEWGLGLFYCLILSACRLTVVLLCIHGILDLLPRIPMAQPTKHTALPHLASAVSQVMINWGSFCDDYSLVSSSCTGYIIFLKEKYSMKQGLDIKKWIS